MLLEVQTQAADRRRSPRCRPLLATCWAAAIGKCNGYPGCRAACPFYEPASSELAIEMTPTDFRAAEGGER
mgnify:CR=1 FL=1